LPRNLLSGFLIPSLRSKQPPVASLSSMGNILLGLLFPLLRFGAGVRTAHVHGVAMGVVRARQTRYISIYQLKYV
jgi:hypothetical protein